ncbi:bifunctional NAD(P)H-hydrate repair enzyme Nnr [Desulfomarina profundi]|uniref:Bifunctional NAD(P)H-hydrate repair enzyme n=1 Tax=Desulfomarina profundi TaxID=2772557 RepID=A0A8D5FFS4_9BACT|nr:NAD(P)H-hydrate dehydratase [Desulfomarina profundi]BCL60852.1 bifunctional NAD(P)H-hydrate repair enzyme Nnr [Desulfomarina profundi]
MKLPTSSEMKGLDTSAIEEFNIPSIVLMENAGLGTVKMMEKQCGPCKDTFALIFVGPGNNGGDGLVIGRHLHQRGCKPVFFFLVNPDSLKGDAAVNLKIIKKLRLPFHVIDTPSRVETIPILLKQFESRGLPCYAIIDAIFGIGLTRKVESHFADTINLINRKNFAHRSPVISVDTPSGMDADTGKVLGTCIRANYTATYCCAKPGHFIHGSASWTGKLEIIDIGIPPETIYNADIRTELTTRESCRKITCNLNRKKASHKGIHGHLLIIAGSSGKTGAAVLAAKGGLRAGAGLVTLCVPHKLNSIFEATVVEAMTIPLPNSTDYILHDDIDLIIDAVQGKKAVVLGPGLGTDPSTAKLVMQLYSSVPCPMIIDADAFNILAANKEEIPLPAGPRIFTPHPGELSRLIGKTADDIQNNRLEATAEGCDVFSGSDHETIFMLKGAGTLITSGDGKTVINTSGNPGMATGGMGDVLTGIIGALICQGVSVRNSAIAGVFLHGCAGDCLYEKKGAGYTASELADAVPVTIKKFLND